MVTKIASGSPEHIYDTLYCARGQMENLIKLHKCQLASDRTSCRAPLSNQMRLFLHTAAYWLMLELREAIPKLHPLAVAEFVTLRESSRSARVSSRPQAAFGLRWQALAHKPGYSDI